MQRYIFKQGKITMEDEVIHSSSEHGITDQEFGVLIIVKNRPELTNYIDSKTTTHISEMQNDLSKNQ